MNKSEFSEFEKIVSKHFCDTVKLNTQKQNDCSSFKVPNHIISNIDLSIYFYSTSDKQEIVRRIKNYITVIAVKNTKLTSKMSVRSAVFKFTEKVRGFSSIRREFTAGKIIYNKPPSESSIPADVPGLSEAVVKVANEPVGPGAAKSGNYKNPEYYCYDKNSYYEAEIEMNKYRCPQPSNKVKYVQKS